MACSCNWGGFGDLFYTPLRMFRTKSANDEPFVSESSSVMELFTSETERNGSNLSTTLCQCWTYKKKKAVIGLIINKVYFLYTKMKTNNKI